MQLRWLVRKALAPAAILSLAAPAALAGGSEAEIDRALGVRSGTQAAGAAAAARAQPAGPGPLGAPVGLEHLPPPVGQGALAVAMPPPAQGSERRPLDTSERLAGPRMGPLTPREMAAARVAWRYFERNVQDATGLPNAADGFPSATVWDMASYLAAVVSAEALGIIGRPEADARLGKLTRTLGTMPLFRGECPNKAYNTITAQPSTYANEPGEIGCSAIDMGRLMAWLDIVRQRYPALAMPVDRVVSRWSFCNVVDPSGILYGAVIGEGGETVWLQEGRLGYEEYAAKGFELWGFDVARAASPEPYQTIWLHDVEIPFDARDPRVLGAHTYVVTESYALMGIEFGWDEVGDTTSGPLVHTDEFTMRAAQNVYEAQVRRSAATGIWTARTEHQLSDAPYFVYDTVFSDGVPWATITEAGEFVPQFAAVASKGAVGLWALWQTPYTDRLFDLVLTAYDPQRGFYEGLFEGSLAPIPAFTANNNGIILETLLFKAQGPIHRGGRVEGGGWGAALANPTLRAAQCLPGGGGRRAGLEAPGPGGAAALAAGARSWAPWPVAGAGAHVGAAPAAGAPVAVRALPEGAFGPMPQGRLDPGDAAVVAGLEPEESFWDDVDCSASATVTPRYHDDESDSDRAGQVKLFTACAWTPLDRLLVTATAFAHPIPDQQQPWDPDFTYTAAYRASDRLRLSWENYSGNRWPFRADRGNGGPAQGTLRLAYDLTPSILDLGAKPTLLSGPYDCALGAGATPRYYDDSAGEDRWGKGQLTLGCGWSPLERLALRLTALAYPGGGTQQPWDPDYTYSIAYRVTDTVTLEYANYSGNRYPWRNDEGDGGPAQGQFRLGYDLPF